MFQIFHTRPLTYLLTFELIPHLPSIPHPSSQVRIHTGILHPPTRSLPIDPHLSSFAQTPIHFRKPINTASAELYFTSYFLLNKQMHSIAPTAAFLLLSSIFLGSNRRKEEEEDVYII